ncbi:uncharacterized protein LOC113324470 [Papaver somniferum]|uniref:uncharacterized protein LOC113324470 n=1 Tax=Papaver somniferum TaxID=3469 RepID=UPI000E6F9732|nr:uncharacterized protein LOC113324470 [Papaver somniferum]
MELSSTTSSSLLHFFKIILDHTIQDKRLDIPKEFLKKFENELSDTATIEVPSGSIYEGDSKFHVLIFNTTATEIEYPDCSIVHNFRNNYKDKALVINLDSYSSDSNNGTSSQTESLSSSGGHVSLKTEPADEHDILKQRKVFSNTLNTGRSSTSWVTQSKALAKAKEFKSEKPFFIAIMPPSSVKN